MTNFLKDAQNLLIDFETQLQRYKESMSQIRFDNPGFEQVSEESVSQTEDTRWLHGSTDIHECNAIEKWLFDKPPLSDLAKEDASKCIKFWKAWLKQSNKYYEGFKEFKIEKPLKNEMLICYIRRIALIVEKEGRGSRLKWRAFKSFLAYLRKINFQESAFIEQIFPLKMDISWNRIIRKIPSEVYPIPIEAAAQLMRKLFEMGTIGRRDGHLSALTSLALCWMCITASRLRLPTYLEMIEKISPKAILIDGTRSYMLVPTLFGNRKIQISNRMAKFLLALSKIPSKHSRDTILQIPKRSLKRTFDRALERCALTQKYGNITYLTLLSHPHHFGVEHRYRPKTESKPKTK